MNCAICNTRVLSGKFIFVNEQKRIICQKCQEHIEAEKEKREERQQ